MDLSLRRGAKTAYNALTHFVGRISRAYYVEDFVRVYPDGLQINRFGIKKHASTDQLRNFLNHKKLYSFASQFTQGAVAADIGCGSGYGCDLLHRAGASLVCGTDASASAIHFAQRHYGNVAEFNVQSITKMRLYADNRFDLTVCSEVLEHIKEYGKEDEAVEELARITIPGGIIVIATPNLWRSLELTQPLLKDLTHR